MKTLIADNGGRPVKNEDLQLFEQAYDLLNGIMSDVMVDGIPLTEFIVYGCDRFGSGPWGFNAGVIFKDGVLYSFAATGGVVSIVNQSVDFSVVENTPREFFDGVTRNTISTGIADNLGAGTDFDLSTAARFSDFIRPQTDRGDPAAADFTEASFIFDNTWRDLPLASKTPVGARSVMLRVDIITGSSISDGIRLDFRKKGNVNSINIGTARYFTPTAVSETFLTDVTVFMDGDRTVQYKAQNTGANFMNVTVGSYSF